MQGLSASVLNFSRRVRVVNPICTYYAIRRKGTYLFLPACDRGATHTEPVDCTVFPMRLFLKRLSANKALRAWLKGKWEVKYEASQDTSWPFSPVEATGLKIIPEPSRDIRDMEVVPVYLRLNQGDMV